MSRINRNQPLLPSVLDRLLDDEPQNKRELPASGTQVLRKVKESLQRDLENLLNTRWRCESWPPDWEELDASLVNYGLPDFTGVDVSPGSGREELRRIVERVIRRFEPRLKSVRVSLLKNADELDRVIRFRIDALLQAEPAPEPVSFDSQLEPASATFEIKRPSR
jgi:type VI secretion system protein ImpF